MKAGFAALGAAASGVLVAAYGIGATFAAAGLVFLAATALGALAARGPGERAREGVATARSGA
jgi:hypothetical protein